MEWTFLVPQFLFHHPQLITSTHLDSQSLNSSIHQNDTKVWCRWLTLVYGLPLHTIKCLCFSIIFSFSTKLCWTSLDTFWVLHAATKNLAVWSFWLFEVHWPRKLVVDFHMLELRCWWKYRSSAHHLIIIKFKFNFTVDWYIFQTFWTTFFEVYALQKCSNIQLALKIIPIYTCTDLLYLNPEGLSSCYYLPNYESRAIPLVMCVKKFHLHCPSTPSRPFCSPHSSRLYPTKQKLTVSMLSSSPCWVSMPTPRHH